MISFFAVHVRGERMWLFSFVSFFSPALLWFTIHRFVLCILFACTLINMSSMVFIRLFFFVKYMRLFKSCFSFNQFLKIITFGILKKRISKYRMKKYFIQDDYVIKDVRNFF